MKTVLVSTIPRSGTWAIKYFLQFLAHFTAHGPDARFDIRDIRAKAQDISNVCYLQPLGVHQVINSHFTFPGRAELRNGWPYGEALKALKRRLLFEEFDEDQNLLIKDYEPSLWPEQRCILVYRNIFEQFMSLVSDYAERRAIAPDSHSRFNAQWPIYSLVFADLPIDAPLQDYFDRMPSTQVVECYALYLLSFLAGQKVYGSERVSLMRYGGLQKNPKEFFLRLVSFLGVDVETNVFDAAVGAVELRNMKLYEQQLGGPISGAVTRFSHMSTKGGGGYRDYVSPSVARQIKTRMQAYGIDDAVWRSEDDALLSGR